MKAVILAGGLGTRLAEETVVRPKPLVDIGGKPIIWHIMKIYSAHGINDFVICLGYKGYMLKEYFVNYALHVSDISVDLVNNNLELHQNFAEPWRISLIETGEQTQTGGRLRRVKEHLNNEDFCFTYGDGVGNVDITQLLAFHREHGKLATITAVRPPARFGAMVMEGNRVRHFEEKPRGDNSWINGGFFVLKPQAIDYIDGDHVPWEHAPLKQLCAHDQLQAYYHDGFWQPMDTLRDRQYLEELWNTGSAPWKVWP